MIAFARKLLRHPARAVLLLGCAAALAGAAKWPATAVSVRPLWKFTGGADGGGSGAALIIDGAGNLYGTSHPGGANNLGTAFIVPTASQTLTATPIWTFTGGADGAMPMGALVRDQHGWLYGTTSGGGAYGGGTVFQLRPPQSGTVWAETTLYSFNPATDGGSPAAGLIVDSNGNFYGTTGSYGPGGFGTVFELAPSQGQSSWTETTLWSFSGGADGGNPYASLLIDTAGNLYGTATHGGTNPVGGLVFELSPQTGGAAPWTQTVLWNFTGPDGARPAAALIADKSGNLYGTCAFGGANQRGTAFELSPPAFGRTSWTETTLLDFAAAAGGFQPFSALLADSTGALFGTTYGYSPRDFYTAYSTIYRLTPPQAGTTAWTETTLATMVIGDGLSVLAPLIASKTGDLFGTAILGGVAGSSAGFGTVFRVRGTGYTP